MNQKYECCECGWIGLHSEKAEQQDSAWTTDVCPECNCDEFYQIDETDVISRTGSEAVRFGNWLNEHAEKWGSEWVLKSGKNFTTAQLYERFQIIDAPALKSDLA